MPPMEKLGKYEIRRELGRGAMGVVWEGYDPMIKRVVAIKTIRADQLAREEADDILARFRREAQAAGRLNHPNIVAIYDFAEDEGTSFIAMEYVEGRDLRDCFAANERFAAADAFRIMEQILAALEYSHARGVVHRDIKPANVFVQPDGTVKVADFGIAHIESSSLTQAGSVMGTPGYMSPEQVLGLPVDGRSDLFSAGVILYQFLTGERPFAASNATTTAQKVLKEEPLPPSTLNVQLPDALDAVVRKALAKKPEERFQSAAEFAAAMRAAAGHRLAGATLPTNAVASAAPTQVAAATIAGGAAEPTVLATQSAATNVRALAATTVVGDPRGAAIPKAPAYGAPKSQAATIAGVAAVAAVAGVLSVAVAAGAWMLWPKSPPPEAAAGAPPASSVSTVTFPALAQAPGAPAAGASSAASPQAPVASPPPAAPSPASPQPAAAA
ncbi:MAG TPA: serine/threonine-protein kinase, partial [Casimicrobiaceae bacterium]|nr:serine/threonine-protein kinase [Casimicrobiaceae bacterium]